MLVEGLDVKRSETVKQNPAPSGTVNLKKTYQEKRIKEPEA